MEQRKLFFFYDGKLWKIISLLRLVSRITNAFLCLNYASRYANFASVLYKTNFLLKLFVFFTAIVNSSTYLIETSIMANIRYFPSNGTTKDVGGMISTTNRKNTWRLMRIEIESVTWNCEMFVENIFCMKNIR